MTEGMRRLWNDKTWFICWVIIGCALHTKYLLVFTIIWSGFTLFTKLSEGHRCMGGVMVATLITILLR